MKYFILMKHRRCGQVYCFSHFEEYGDGLRAVNTMLYHADVNAKSYPSIAAACADYKLIDKTKWRPLIVRASRHLFNVRWNVLEVSHGS